MCYLGSKNHHTSQGRATILKRLHQNHSGMARMKGLAHSYMPGMDRDVEKVVQNCEVCQNFQKAQAPLHPWEWPGSPWERLNVD